MANKKLTPLEILYREFKNAKTDAARNDAWRRFETKRGEMYPPRSDRKSAMLRDSAAVAAKYPTKVLGGENHRYYEPGRRIRMDVDETAKRSPEVFVDPESGERYVRAFHYTQPENIENILKTGLAARLGPDAKNFQNRAGVWTSMGDANPMGYDYVNNAYVGEKNYRMDPLEIRIPEEEWKSMVVDHTGKTGDDQVMVFRDSPSKPYGTVDINGEKAPVVIPPEYISRYEFPKDWTMPLRSGGNTLYGYAPNKKELLVNDRSFVETSSPELVKKAREALGDEATNNQIAQWIVDNAQAENKKFILENNGSVGYGGLRRGEFRNAFPMPRNPRRKDVEENIVRNLPYETRRQWFENTEFETPYDFARATEDSPSLSKGVVRRGYEHGSVFEPGTPAPRTEKFLNDVVGDKKSFKSFIESDGYYDDSFFIRKAENQGIEVPSAARYSNPHDYLKNAGFRFNLGESYNRNDARRTFGETPRRYSVDEKKAALREWNNDFFRNNYKDKIDAFLDENDPVKAKQQIQEFHDILSSPEVSNHRRKALKEYIDDGFINQLDQYNRNWRKNPTEYARNKAVTRARIDEGVEDRIFDETEKYLAEHPELDHVNDYDRVLVHVTRTMGPELYKPLEDKYYEEELQDVRKKIIDEWKDQFKQDSLNRVFGHELGRKVGKYRASRGKPVNPKQL